MFRKIVIVLAMMPLGSYIALSQLAYAQPTTPGEQKTTHTPPYRLSFAGPGMTIELVEAMGTREITINRLERKISTKDPLYDRIAISKASSSEPKKQTFHFDQSFTINQVVPFEITIAMEQEDEESFVSIIYLKATADGKITETTWAEYACAQKLYVCGKDWRGRPAMRLLSKR